jgi:hypothetical protein
MYVSSYYYMCVLAPGSAGASLANLMNEAAIFAARKNMSVIGNEQVLVYAAFSYECMRP